MDLSEILNELGEDREHYYHAVSPPVMQTSNFVFPSAMKMHEMLKNESQEILYTRGNNPTVNILRNKFAALEKTEDSLVFASGCAAISAAILCNVSKGDHVICINSPYSWTNKLLNDFLPRFGVTTTMIDGTDTENFRKALRPETRLIYLESPSTFLFELQDLAAVSALAREKGLLTLIDNSCASPVFQNPSEFGIDIVLHSATKYIGGHSDTVGGILCASREMIQKIHIAGLMMLGGIISPWNAWLLLRSLRTLPLRMERISNSTAQILKFLCQRPEIEKVYYPFLESNPQFDLASRQMKKGAGLFTLALKTDHIHQVAEFCESLHHFLLAVSWGGHESLVLPVFTTFKTLDKAELNPHFKLVRLYIGLDNPELLIKDLEQALNKTFGK